MTSAAPPFRAAVRHRASLVDLTLLKGPEDPSRHGHEPEDMMRTFEVNRQHATLTLTPFSPMWTVVNRRTVSVDDSLASEALPPLHFTRCHRTDCRGM